MPENTDRTPLAEDDAAGGTVLLIVDMLSDWRFPDGEALLAASLPAAERIAALKARCRMAGVPTVYVNDNQGRWRSDFRAIVDHARDAGGSARRIVELLEPVDDDYFVLKPKHSAFHETPLDLLLRHLGAKTIVITGVTTDQCILYSAAHARMLDYTVVVPRDAVAAQSDDFAAVAMRHLQEVQRIAMPPAADVELPTPQPKAA